MTRQEELDLAAKKAKATLPRGQRERDLAKAIAQWKHDNPTEADRYRQPKQKLRH